MDEEMVFGTIIEASRSIWNKKRQVLRRKRAGTVVPLFRHAVPAVQKCTWSMERKARRAWPLGTPCLKKKFVPSCWNGQARRACMEARRAWTQSYETRACSAATAVLDPWARRA
ncbi:unnamed protein product [Cuscuta epithymum]|uniref:Uncharacterized protein n=1 Tax=Cuscuta epithymum TaxID=186058 RepID=A0AAV0C8N2_9ASTE|nr:unnamed protein product [Cuscuta epithymum]